MTSPRIPINDLSRAWLATSPEAREAVARVLASGWYVNGPELAALETELADRFETDHVIGVASGTDGLALALQVVGCTPGAEVVTAANAGGYTSVAAAQVGLRVAYADVDPNTLLVTADSISDALGPLTRAVVVTHLYGNVADVESIVDVCRPRGISVVEDCAQAFGAKLAGRAVGTIGDAAAISFYPTKNLGAAGDAGAVITANSDAGIAVRSLKQYGWSSKYTVVRPDGRNSRLDEIQAAVLRVGLCQIDQLNASRKGIVDRYLNALPATVGRMVTGATPSWVAHLAVGRFHDRDLARGHLSKAGIETDIHYPVPDHHQTGLRPPVRQANLPVTELAASEILTIPCFAEMNSAEVDRVCDALRTIGS